MKKKIKKKTPMSGRKSIIQWLDYLENKRNNNKKKEVS